MSNALSIPQFPTLVTRQGKGSPLSNAEVDANFLNIRQYALTLANMIGAAASTATDTGTLNAYAITVGMPISAYANGQTFFVYTQTTNTDAATLNVNTLGPVPIVSGGNPITTGEIGANSIFIVSYQNGQFILLTSGLDSSSSAATDGFTFTFSGTSLFSSGNLALPGVQTDANGNIIGGSMTTIAHGLVNVPTEVKVLLYKIASDATDSLAEIGQYVPASSFVLTDATTNDVLLPAFSWAYDGTEIVVKQAAGTPTLAGIAITPASWNLVVTASLQTNVSNIAFPDLTYQIAQPQGGFTYGNSLFVWQSGATSHNINGLIINLTNNEATVLSAPAAGQITNQNHAVFTRSSGVIADFFTTISGVFVIPVNSPAQNIVPATALYSAAGVYVVNVSQSTTYTITQGSNDLKYSLDGATYTALTSTPVAVATGSAKTLYLKGSANSAVTASVALASGVWQPTQVIASTAALAVNQVGPQNTSQYQYWYKPVAITEASDGTVSAVYVAPSNASAGIAISNVPLYKIPNSGGPVLITPSGIPAGIDFTSPAIAGSATFRSLYPNGSQAKIAFFQYNPFKQRIYLMTNETNLLHIFDNLSNDSSIVDLWTNANRLGLLAYEKTIALGGGGTWAISTTNNITIEIDQGSGQEKAIVFTLANSVTRIPWVTA